MEVVMTKERISAALVIETCRVDKGSAAHDVRHCEANFQMQGTNTLEASKFVDPSFTSGRLEAAMVMRMALSSPEAYLFDVYYDGIFYFNPLRYENGCVFGWRLLKEKKMDYASMIKYLKKETDQLNFHSLFFCLPECELEVGLKLIEGDRDVASLYEFAESYGKIIMYMTHIPQDLADFYHLNLSFDESEDEATSRMIIHGNRKKDASNMSFVELLSWAEEEAQIGNSHDMNVVNKGKTQVNDDVIPVKEAVDNGKSKMIQVYHPVKKPIRKNNGIQIQENVNPTVMDSDTDSALGINFSLYSDSDSDYSDKSVDYLSEGEDELIDLRKRKTEAKKVPKSTNQKTLSDMVGSSSGIRRRRVYEVGDSETIIEHEEFMDDLIEKLKDGGDVTTDPFKILESKVEKYPIHDVDTHWRMRKPKVGEKFDDVDQLKECLTYYALANGFSLWFYRSSNTQLIARCGLRPEKLKDTEKGKQRKWKRYPSTDEVEGASCPFRCYGKEMTDEKSFQVISMTDDHTCVRHFKYGTLVNYKWIGKHFGTKIRLNPEIKLHEIADLVMKKYKCIVSPAQCRNAKRWALNEGETTMEDHYGYIRSYGKAILESNPGSTVKVGVTVNPDDKTYFDRFYVCFKGLKEGWKLGCRKVIALDGCFLKKPNVGEILTAIGRDANNHIYPVAWAVVNVENKDNWRWFLDLLGDDLDMPNGNGLTLMSDQHKGLIEAVKEVMPHAEHGQCARHIYEGFRKLYSGVEFRRLFWAASKASYPRLFNKIMSKIKTANPNAYEYLLKKDPKSWSRAYFHIGTNCEAVENGFSECFNSVILSVRNKPLITMLEAIRVIVLERMNTMRRLYDTWTEYICPNIQNRLELIKDLHRFWHVIPTGGELFEVRNGSEAFGVDEQRRLCTCRLWQLSGHNKTSCQNETVVLPPKPPCKKGRPRKIQLGVEEQVVDEPHDAPVVKGEHSSPLESDPVEDSGNAMFEATQNSHIATNIAFAGTQGSQTINQHVADQEPVANQLQQAAPRQRSKRILKRKLAKKVGSGNAMFEATQNSHIATNIAFAGTQGSQTTNQHVADQEPVANQLQQAAPRQRSERILKRKLAKKVGSSSSNAYEWE
ncbi:pentatricopeptide repeat-containing protein [Tanacetum coccineum]